jgi:hypothetical protein
MSAVMPLWVSIVESLVKSLAILAAGGWAVYLFFRLGQVARARLEIDKVRLERDKVNEEIDKVRLERGKLDQEVNKLQREIIKLDTEMKTHAVLSISIKSAQLIVPSDPAKYINTIVEVCNKGTRTARLIYDTDEHPFLITPVSFDQTGNPCFGDQIRHPIPQSRNPSAAVLSNIVRPGATEVIPFLCRVSASGVYFVSYRAEVTAEENLAPLYELGVPKYNPISWTAKTYVMVN